MDPLRVSAEDELFPSAQPWDVVDDSLWVSHSEFWLVAGSGPGIDIVSAVPEGDSIKGNGGAVGIPTRASETRIAAVVSVWEGAAPHGDGAFLGTCRITVPDRELALVNVEGREPGPVLVLPEEGEHTVSVWRRDVSGSDAAEQYDIRVWRCLTQ
ncbi:hypothetical protein OG259_40080 [Streptomyces sp. NBC_00250]|uniref:hypothetical protein n=1 Tax=Streptomyces sp. NBC_00250 TaxID=2903641 RepID=UPI002E2AFF64|nr:hypothetical protein [Streptomyces sp. NBC_00250]